MKQEIHPDYRQVVFQDTATGATFLTRSTMSSADTTTWEDGNEYPLVRVEISSDSHPFFTGKQRLVDSADASSVSSVATAAAQNAQRVREI